jgi:hypothetical protein
MTDVQLPSDTRQDDDNEDSMNDSSDDEAPPHPPLHAESASTTPSPVPEDTGSCRDEEGGYECRQTTPQSDIGHEINKELAHECECSTQLVLEGLPLPLSKPENNNSIEETVPDPGIMSRGSTISWSGLEEVFPIESDDESFQGHGVRSVRRSKRRADVRPGLSKSSSRSLSARMSDSVRSSMDHNYKTLFGEQYDMKEGTFVLLSGMAMAFNMGFVNGSCLTGFLTGGEKQVVAGFAGPFGQSSIAIAQSDWEAFGFYSNLILSYMAGSFVAGSFTPNARPYSIQPNYGPTFLIGGILLFMASVLAALEVDAKYVFYLTTGANGLQNGVASLYSAHLIRCSMTGAITDIALALGQATRGNTKAVPKMIVLSLIVFMFWLGGLASFYTTRRFLSLTLFFNAALFWLIGIVSVVFLVKHVSISVRDAVFGTWQWKKTLRQLGASAGTSHSEAKLYSMFDEIDEDGNGHIDQDELLQYLMQLDNRITARSVRLLIRSADKDFDGKISRDEWDTMIRNLKHHF